MIGDGDCLEEMREKNKRNKNKKYPISYFGRNVTPLVEIHSVRINTSYCTRNCQIYGHIRVTDDDDKFGGDDFDLFNRDGHDPECVDLNNNNTLLLTNSNVIVPSESVKVDVCLNDKAHSNAVLAQGVFTLRRTVVDCKGELRCEIVKGDDVGFVEVHYSVFPFAVVATVSLLYFSKDDDFDLLSDDTYNAEWYFMEGDPNDSDSGCFREHVLCDNIDYDERELATPSRFTNVFGSVIAYNDIVFGGSTDNNASVLFRKSPEQSVQLTSGNFIELSRSIVAVPSNSTLKIQVDLHDPSPLGIHVVEFIPQDSTTVKKDVVGANGRIRVRVEWGDGYRPLHREEMLQTPELLSEQVSPSPPNMCSIGGMPSAFPSDYSIPSAMVEVFSVVVCGNDFKPLTFYGNIKDNGPLCWVETLFSTDRDSPLHCSDESGTLVNFHCHYTLDVMDEFSLWLTFKDAADKSVIIKGRIGWREGYLEATQKWFDRPLCSLIRGDRGFAAIHYAIFHDGISVKLDAKLNGVTASTLVSGTILARYGTVDFDYSNLYEEKYYKSVVFNMETLLKGPDYRLPLLKSIVNFPSQSSLVLDVDVLLWVNPGNDADDGRKVRLQKSIEIQYCSDKKNVERIQEGEVSLEVTASYDEWIYYPTPPEEWLQSVSISSKAPASITRTCLTRI